MEHEDIIDIAIVNVPREFRDDARQAGYVGLINGLRHLDGVENIRGYLYRCVQNEMIKEVAKLYTPFSVSPYMLNTLIKYKKLTRFNSVSFRKVNKMDISEIERILRIKQWSLNVET